MKKTISEQIISEAGSNIVGNIVVDNVSALEQLLSMHQPKSYWFVRFGYVEDVKFDCKYNKNSRGDNEERGRELSDPRINSYLDSDAYKRRSEVKWGGKGAPLKSSPVAPAKNPVDGQLIEIKDVTMQWNSRGYQDKMNFENGIRDRYLDVPRRHARYLQTNDFLKKAQNYAKDNGLDVNDVIEQAHEDVELTKLIAKYVSKQDSNKGGGWELDKNTQISQHTNTGTKALRIYTPGKLNAKPRYFLVADEEVEEVSKEFAKFWTREFCKAPSKSSDSGLEQIIKRISKWSFQNWDLDKIIWMTFTYVDEHGQNVKFTYVNKGFNMANHPAAVAQYFIDKFSKDKIMPESIARTKSVTLTQEALDEVVTRTVAAIVESTIKR